MKSLILIASVFLLSCSPKIETPEQLLGRMKSAYGAEYFKTLTFTQRTVNTLPDSSTREETWFETMKIPGTLSIRFAPLDSGRGIIFRNDSLFIMGGGEQRMARPMIHPLLVLGFDVYAQPVDVTVSKLTELGFDLAIMHEAEWQDRPAYVVGAVAGDDSTKQFWIDAERLLFVRSIETNPMNGVKMEVQFNDYQRVDGGWVGAEVLFLRDGKVRTEEYYVDMKANVEVDEREFNAAEWMYITDGD